MYTFVDFTSQIVGRRGVPCPTNKGVSYTNLVCWLGRDLKNRLLLLLLLYVSFRKRLEPTYTIYLIFLLLFKSDTCQLHVEFRHGITH
jgi:hypothetical protein